jgi:hypothetical protein
MATDRSAGIDAAIDDAARAMTAPPPPEALRRAVLDRVAAPPSGRGWWAGPRLGVAAAAVVLVMAGVHWMSRHAPVMPPSGGPGVASPANTAASRDPVVPAAASPSGVRAATPATGMRRGPRVLRRTATVVVPPSTIDVTPVAIVPLGTEAVVVEPVPVPAAIAIAPIAVSPLSIGVAGDALEE